MAEAATNIKYKFRQHLMEPGFAFDLPKEKVPERFLEHLSDERRIEFQRRTGHNGEDVQNAAYDFVCNFREANLLRSIDLLSFSRR